jgi:hypothetical protein
LSEALENTIVIGQPKAFTKKQWKAAVVRMLKTFSVQEEQAEAEADQLYSWYVDEKGFDFQDFSVQRGFLCQDFSQDPAGALMDHRMYWDNMSGATRYA